MYIVIISNAEGKVLEKLSFHFREEAENVAEAICNLTSYNADVRFDG